MADKRMFTKKITESDAFLDMPASTQNLYFHLNLNADDDGFVDCAKKIMRMIGATEDDLRVLIGKRFILSFDTGVMVIKHWKMHNTIKNDRYHKTPYTSELEMLYVKDNGAYTLTEPEMPALPLNEKPEVPEQTISLKTKTDIYDEYFETIWAQLPNKKGKADVTASVKKTLYKYDHDEMQRIIERYIHDVGGREPRYQPHASRFCKKLWMDYTDEAVSYTPPQKMEVNGYEE